jgi:hypothetical protein
MAVAGTASVSPWIKHDTGQSPFDVTLSVFFDSVLNATLAVQYVADDQSQTSERLVQGVQSASTTATITDYGPETINGAPSNQAWGGPFGHGLLTGDLVFLQGSQVGVDSGNQSGYPVTVTGVNTYTVVTPVNQTSVFQARVTSARVFTHPSLTGLVARATGNYAYPVWMSRLICTAFTGAGKAFLVASQGRN